jgi:F420-dependent oxidoreductase-like protein
MRIGTWPELTGLPVASARAAFEDIEKAGFATAWLGEVGNWDPLTLLGALGPAAPSARLGTAIVRTYPRHPLALAAQALTVQALTGGRLVLGIGPSHLPLIEGQYGLSFRSPVQNFREYLTVLRPLLRGESVDFRGSFWSATGSVGIPDVAAPPVYVSALGPSMLRLAGELADGNLVTWAGPKSIAEYFVPAMASAAADAGRAVPDVVAQLLVSVTSDADGARAWVNERYGAAGDLPSYRPILDREGAATPGDTVVAGDEETIAAVVRRFADVGTAELQVIPVGTDEEKARTFAFLASLARGA